MDNIYNILDIIRNSCTYGNENTDDVKLLFRIK